MHPRLLLAMTLALAMAGAAAQDEVPTSGQEDQPLSVQTFGHATAPGPASQAPATQPATEPSAEEVMQQLLSERPASPLIAPSGSPSPAAVADQTASEPQILGLAPDQGQPPLYREGEFIVSRRGRMLRMPSGQWVFQFEADSQAAPETPMLLMPCQLLENMEELTRQRGDRLVFVLSGQVFTYRGYNWLLPSMMKLDVDRGNLQH